MNQPRLRLRLGDLLVQEGIISDGQLQQALADQKQSGRKQVSNTMKELWTDPDRRKQYSIMMKNRDPEIIKKTTLALTGVPKSEQHKDALSKALKGKPKSEEHRRKLSEVNKGKTMSPESLQKLYNTNQNAEVKAQRSQSAKNRPKVECPHCLRLVDSSTSRRWHFDNCKNKGA